MSSPLPQVKRPASPSSALFVKKMRTDDEARAVSTSVPSFDGTGPLNAAFSENEVDVLITSRAAEVSSATPVEVGSGEQLSLSKETSPNHRSSVVRQRPNSSDMWQNSFQRKGQSLGYIGERSASLSPSQASPVDTNMHSEVQWQRANAVLEPFHASPNSTGESVIRKAPQMIQPPQYVMLPYPFTDIQVAVLADHVTGEVKVLQSITSSPKYKNFSFEELRLGYHTDTEFISKPFGTTPRCRIMIDDFGAAVVYGTLSSTVPIAGAVAASSEYYLLTQCVIERFPIPTRAELGGQIFKVQGVPLSGSIASNIDNIPGLLTKMPGVMTLVLALIRERNCLESRREFTRGEWVLACLSVEGYNTAGHAASVGIGLQLQHRLAIPPGLKGEVATGTSLGKLSAVERLRLETAPLVKKEDTAEGNEGYQNERRGSYTVTRNESCIGLTTVPRVAPRPSRKDESVHSPSDSVRSAPRRREPSPNYYPPPTAPRCNQHLSNSNRSYRPSYASKHDLLPDRAKRGESVEGCLIESLKQDQDSRPVMSPWQEKHGPSKSPNFRCEKCNITYGSQKALEDHRGTPAHAFGTNLTCNPCNRSFQDNDSLNQHLLMSSAHTGRVRPGEGQNIVRIHPERGPYHELGNLEY